MGRERQRDIMKWASKKILPELGEGYPSDSEPQASLNGGWWLVISQGGYFTDYQGDLLISAEPENEVGFSVILEPQEC